MLGHIDVAFRMSGMICHLKIVELLLVFVWIEDSLKAFTVSICLSCSLLIKLDIALNFRLCSPLIVLLVHT